MEVFNNQLNFYPAKLYKQMGENDSRLQVRIIPLMEEYTDDSILPVFPPLFKNTVLNGYTEVDDGVEKAENLLVLSNPDFTFGWVVCKSNVFNMNTPDEGGNVALQAANFEVMKKEMKGAKIDGLLPDLNYENLVVQTLVFENDKDSHEKGGLIEFYNFKTGDKFIFNASGSGIVITAHGVKMFAGEQNTDKPVASAGTFSYIEINPSKIEIGAPKVEFFATDIKLGQGNRYLLGSLSSVASYAEGKNILSIVDKKRISTTVTA